MKPNGELGKITPSKLLKIKYIANAKTIEIIKPYFRFLIPPKIKN